MDRGSRDVESEVLNPLTTAPGRHFWITAAALAGVFLWALLAWGWQIKNGLKVTGLNAPIFWGVYLVNFVFFIGISHAGTLISSILRITETEWRRPFTRAAEAITVFSLPFGATSVIVDLGRPDRLLNVIRYPHFTSPILWDVLCISTYLVTSCLYFYLALIPDIALCRDRFSRTAGPFRRTLYAGLSLGWTGTEAQWKTLHKIMTAMSIFLFALVISVHTNVSFVFGLTTKPGWHTAVIGPYFVVGAIFSGVATVILAMVAIRKLFHFEAYLTDDHFNRIGKFLLALCCFWFYFTFVEFITTFYGRETAHMAVFNAKFFGEYAWLFWAMFACCFLIPLPVLAVKKFRTIPNLVWVCIVVNVGMWLERYSIIVPSGARPYLSWGPAHYVPSWVEWSITAGWLAGFALLFLAFTRLFPILTVWEVKEQTNPRLRTSIDGAK
ncbi:MAG: polysulfide reductase NrfD [Elusimicrobia bacterium]|nr:polysulfide reductase NrfD [Elusimicrobiota bacterium]